MTSCTSATPIVLSVGECPTPPPVNSDIRIFPAIYSVQQKSISLKISDDISRTIENF